MSTLSCWNLSGYPGVSQNHKTRKAMILIYCWRNLHSVKYEATGLTLWSRLRSFASSHFLDPSLYHCPSAKSELLLCVHPLHPEVVLNMPSFLQSRQGSKRCHPPQLPPPQADLSNQIKRRIERFGWDSCLPRLVLEQKRWEVWERAKLTSQGSAVHA